MSKVQAMRNALLGGLVLIGFGAPVMAEPGPGAIVRLSILASPDGHGGYDTKALSVAVGFGTGFEGATFGDPSSGSIGAAVGNGGPGSIVIHPPVQNQYESIVCTTTCEVWGQP